MNKGGAGQPGGEDRPQSGQARGRDDTGPDGQRRGRGQCAHGQEDQGRGGGGVAMSQSPLMKTTLPVTHGEWGQAPQPTTQPQELTYNRRAGTSGIGGQLYEIELLMWFLLHGVTQKEDGKIEYFYLATNMEEAGDFDDVVFKYGCNENGVKKSKIVFLQAKHKETEKSAREKKIAIDTLLSQSEKGDFILRKYLSSYRKIKQLRNIEDNLLFKDGVESCNFVIYTNAVFNFDKCRDCVEKAYIESGDILNLKDESQEYFYKLNSNEEVMDALRHSLDFEILVKELAQCFCSGSIDRNKPIFKDYQVSLVERVIEKRTQTEGKVRKEFLNGEQDSEFRNAFFQEIKKKKEFATKTDDALKEELMKKNIQVTNNFGSANDNLKIPLPSKLVSDTEIREFLFDLKLFVSQPNEGQLGEIIKQKIQVIYKVEQNDINTVFADVEYKVRKWWREGDGYITESNNFFQKSARVSFWFDVQKPVDLFTGRLQELSDLHSQLQHGSEKVSVISQITSVSGLGGIGKSELARKYAYNHANDYDGNVIWINAESYQTLAESFLRLAHDKLGINVKGIDGNQKHIKSIVGNVYGFFSKRKSLFIFDNAEKRRTQDDGDEGIDKFLPSLPSNANKPYILITSRNQKWGNIKVIPLGIFTEEEAADFIREALNIKDDSQKNEIQTLLKLLHRFPLALQQAVAYINERDKAFKIGGSKFEISDYLKRYDKETKKLLDFKFLDDSSDLYTKTTLTTWRLTIDRIKRNNEIGKQAWEILAICAYLAPDSIPVQMFLGSELRDVDEEILYDAVQLLMQYSMVNYVLNPTVLNIHRLVQQVTRIELEVQSKNVGVIQEAFRLLRKMFPYRKYTSEDYSKKRELLPHLEVFLSHIDYWITKSLEIKNKINHDYLEDLLIWMSDGYSGIGEPRRNMELLERALGIQEKHYGSDHFEVARTLGKLGNAYGALGEPQKQKELLERALAIKETHYGSDHFEVASTLMNLTNAYGALGEPQKRMDLLQRALAIEEKHYGSDHFEVARTLGNLGNAYGALGEPQKQKELLERALAIKETHYGSDHFEVASTLGNLSNAYGALGEPQKKMDLLQRALAIEEKHYGSNHFEVAKILVNLSNAYSDLGEPQKQKDLLQRALAIEEKHYGSDHFEVARILVNLSNANSVLGEPQKQKVLLERALPIKEKHYGSDHFEVASTLGNLGNAYGALGEPQKKKDLLQRALAIEEKHYGSVHFEVAKTLVNLSNAYSDLGEPQKQKDLLEQALPILEKHYGFDHFEVARTLVNLGIAYGDLGEPHKQKGLLERTLQIQEKHYGSDHFEVARTLVNLGIAYGDLGEPQKKMDLLEQALPILERHYGCDHSVVAITLRNLISAYGALGNHQKQKELLERDLSK